MTTRELIERLKNPDDAVRGPAWQQAGPMGASSVNALAELMASSDLECARAATRALWSIVRYAGRPGAAKEAARVSNELALLIADGGAGIRREFLWMLSEIGDGDVVHVITALLSEPDLREGARAALQRIPSRKALDALKTGLASAPEDYKPAIAVSLRARGETIREHPNNKLVPSKQTEVKQVPAN